MTEQEERMPYIPANPFGIKQKFWERIWLMRLLDDTLMRAVFDDNVEAVQLVLRILLDKDDLTVTRVRTQREYKNLFGHSVCLDVEATDRAGVLYNIEVQRASAGACPERARYHAALMDAHTLHEGEDETNLPESYVVFITEADFWKRGLPVYHIERTVAELGEAFGDRCHILYANGAYRGEDAVGRLMADFRENDPARMRYPALSARMEHLKYSEKEVVNMCRALEETYAEGREGRAEGRAEGRMEVQLESVRNLMNNLGMTLEQAMHALGHPMEELPEYRRRLGLDSAQ